MIALSDRRLISISGEDKEEFLQGLITNDVNKLRDDNALFACMLTPQGKFLFDFFLYKKDGRIIIDINEKFLNDFIKKLKIYKLRSNIEVSELEGSVFLDTENSDGSYPDPRNPKFGGRVIKFDKQGQTSSLDEYHDRRIKYKMVDGAYDLIQDKSFILEYGYNEMNAIDFDKGCYIGQEVTTRTFRRGVIRKAIYIINLDDSLKDVEQGDSITFADKKVGSLCFKHGDKAFALLKKDSSDIALY